MPPPNQKISASKYEEIRYFTWILYLLGLISNETRLNLLTQFWDRE